MRAVIVRNFGPVEQATIGEFPKPVPGPHDILLEVDATAANFVDTLVIGGTYQFLPELPFVPGKLPAGTVAEVGSAVKTLKGAEFTISRPRDLFFAWTEIIGRIVKLKFGKTATASAVAPVR